jgi:acyl carrier protein
VSERASVAERIKAVLADECDLEPTDISDEAQLRNLPRLDSLRLLSAIARIERLYDIELDHNLFYEVETLSQLVDAVHAALKPPGAAAS